MCRSRRELSNAYLLAKIGVDTAENEPLEVWGENLIQYSLHSLLAFRPGLRGGRCGNGGGRGGDQISNKGRVARDFSRYTRSEIAVLGWGWRAWKLMRNSSISSSEKPTRALKSSTSRALFSCDFDDKLQMGKDDQNATCEGR